MVNELMKPSRMDTSASDGAMDEIVDRPDEVGYVPWPTSAQVSSVISDRAERAALIVTTNLPFSEWTTVLNPRLWALLDRITDRAHIIETGTDHFSSGEPWKGRKKR